MIILASQSPRRQELLHQIGVDHQPCPVDVDEARLPGEPVQDMVCRLALAKAHAGRQLHPDMPVLGADTLVVLDGEPLGKPNDRRQGLEWLAMLGGRTHQVMTAVALTVQGGEDCLLSQSLVRFRSIGRKEAEDYWDSGEPADKAGGYAIQGFGAVFIDYIEGSYSGIMGLPLFETARLLSNAGLLEPPHP